MNRTFEPATLDILGGCSEQGRACFCLTAGGNRWLFDCGVKRELRDEQVGEYPLLEKAEPPTLEGVILSHAHEDHCASLPLLYRLGFNGLIYCTQPTAEMTLDYCHAWLRTVRRYGKEAPFSEADIQRLRFCTLELWQSMDLGGMELTFLPAGHILGSAMCVLKSADFSLVYTGDASWGSRMLPDPPELPQASLYLIDGAYGVKPYQREASEADLFKAIQKTREKGGITLLPVPRIGRAQETLLQLYEQRAELPPVYLEANIRDACHVHLKYAAWLRPGASAQLQQALDWVNVIETPAQRQAVAQNGPAVVLASDGMVSNGTVLEYYQAFKENPNHSLILTGYQAPGTLGERLLNHKEPDVKLNVEQVVLLVHPTLADYRRFFQDCQGQVWIAHNQPEICTPLAEQLSGGGLKAQVPAVGERVVINT